MKNIVEKYSEVLKALGGKDDKVLSTCPECSFETRENKYGVMVSHGPLCSKRTIHVSFPESSVDMDL